MLEEADTFGINRNFGAPEKKFIINFSNGKTKFCLSSHYSHNNSYLFVNGKKTNKIKEDNKKANFPTEFCQGSISNFSDKFDESK